MVVLIGPAGKNTTLLVEFAKVRGDAGLPTAEATVEAARLRFGAVMMTALSFILGPLPLVFASGWVRGDRRDGRGHGGRSGTHPRAVLRGRAGGQEAGPATSATPAAVRAMPARVRGESASPKTAQAMRAVTGGTR